MAGLSSREMTVSAIASMNEPLSSKQGVRAFVLVRRSLSGPTMAATFVQALPAIRRFVTRYQPPFIARVTQTGRVSLLLKRSPARALSRGCASSCRSRTLHPCRGLRDVRHFVRLQRYLAPASSGDRVVKDQRGTGLHPLRRRGHHPRAWATSRPWFDALDFFARKPAASGSVPREILSSSSPFLQLPDE